MFVFLICDSDFFMYFYIFIPLYFKMYKYTSVSWGKEKSWGVTACIEEWGLYWDSVVRSCYVGAGATSCAGVEGVLWLFQALL